PPYSRRATGPAPWLPLRSASVSTHALHIHGGRHGRAEEGWSARAFQPTPSIFTEGDLRPGDAVVTAPELSTHPLHIHAGRLVPPIRLGPSVTFKPPPPLFTEGDPEAPPEPGSAAAFQPTPSIFTEGDLTIRLPERHWQCFNPRPPYSRRATRFSRRT